MHNFNCMSLTFYESVADFLRNENARKQCCLTYPWFHTSGFTRSSDSVESSEKQDECPWKKST